MLARILLLKPKLIIADEPLSMVDVSLRAMFLDNLIEYKEKLNISSLFITHDLNVAHYVSDKIMVLARGEIVESGDTDLVVRKPLHPYTKELIESIPVPDPDNRWKKKVEVKETYFREVTDENQCINYNKCSFAMDMCKKEKPPMIKMENGQEVACFLYREKK
jgi:peptide/nickel transport system ATP-binding protein